jgi:fatty-acyl-CoA synthase
MNAAHTNAYGISVHDVAMPLTPMFHVNAGGLPYIAPLCGAALVLVGPKIDGEIMQSLIESERGEFHHGRTDNGHDADGVSRSQRQAY